MLTISMRVCSSRASLPLPLRTGWDLFWADKQAVGFDVAVIVGVVVVVHLLVDRCCCCKGRKRTGEQEN